MITAPTWHNAAAKEEIAPFVLLPGDPKRSAYIAKNFLTDAVLVNDIRGVQGYTGTYSGRRVTVMATGMGMPAMAIYAKEFYEAYDVETIVRVGSMGSLRDDVRLGDIVASMSCCTDSSIASKYRFPGVIAPTADFSLLQKADANAKEMGIRLHVGPTMCSDTLYDEVDGADDAAVGMHLLGSDMETAALYYEAMRAGRRAVSLCTVVSGLFEEEIPPQRREDSFNDMIRLALSLA